MLKGLYIFTLIAVLGSPFSRAVKLYDKGMYSNARTEFENIYSETASSEAKGYSILCSAARETYGYVHDIERNIHIPRCFRDFISPML